MEVRSGSSSTSTNININNNNKSDRDGLKFGKKIYFEAAGGGGGSGRPPPAPAKKGRREANPGGAQPPRCQVEGCKVDLSDAKTYYSRHKVCGTHSKSPQVIVGGLQQRFCQQCSRFHQLPEFDQGKRSCRRRLAGHNERRRKPQPGSLLSPRFGTLSSSLFETSSRPGSFLMDFSSYSSFSGRDLWPNARTSQRAASNQPTALGKSLQHPWQNNHESPPELLMQGSASRGATTYVPSGVSSGECYAGVSDSSRALSLLSTQSWDTRNQSLSLGMNGLLRPNGTSVVRPSGFLGEVHNYFSSSPWGFKGDENNRGSHEIPPNLGLGHLFQAASNQYSSDFNASQQLNGRECLGLEYSRGYESPVQHLHRSL